MTRLIRASADPRLMMAAAATLVGMGASALILTRASVADAPPVIELPARKTGASPPPVDTPAVPVDAEQIPAVHFQLETTWHDARGSRRAVQHVTRTADRIHLVLEGGQREWLFTRNPVFPDRVSGLLIDHGNHRIEQYDESDLQRQLLFRGWADVLTMRVDPRHVASLADTGERRTVAGITFYRYRAADAATGLVDAWWSPSLLLA
ncbi:MAG: hypothetical protein IT178_16780, partial [Acidobacteria bacterium]|nr:hypothetical protein [Acidobacteriota bacterium]